MPRTIIAIIDTLANDILGPLQIFPHDAPAIRMFGDVALDNRTAVHAHVTDYELRAIGVLEDDLTVTPQHRVLITGQQWQAAQSNNNQEA